MIHLNRELPALLPSVIYQSMPKRTTGLPPDLDPLHSLSAHRNQNRKHPCVTGADPAESRRGYTPARFKTSLTINHTPTTNSPVANNPITM